MNCHIVIVPFMVSEYGVCGLALVMQKVIDWFLRLLFLSGATTLTSREIGHHGRREDWYWFARLISTVWRWKAASNCCYAASKGKNNVRSSKWYVIDHHSLYSISDFQLFCCYFEATPLRLLTGLDWRCLHAFVVGGCVACVCVCVWAVKGANFYYGMIRYC